MHLKILVFLFKRGVYTYNSFRYKTNKIYSVQNQPLFATKIRELLFNTLMGDKSIMAEGGG